MKIMWAPFDELGERIRELGWACSDCVYQNDEGQYIIGGTGPKEDRHFTGVTFIVLKAHKQRRLTVRLAGPGQLTTETTVDSSSQVVGWMQRIVPALTVETNPKTPQCRAVWVPGILQPPEPSRPKVRTRCQFDEGHSGPCSFAQTSDDNLPHLGSE